MNNTVIMKTFGRSSTHYALTNHLGNVMAVISDAPSDGAQPTVESLTDYYPFGMSMPGRNYVRNGGGYRYGYTGHEKESDMAEGVYTTQYRLLDTRLGRWMSVDPLFAKYPNMGSYGYCEGNPVRFIDLKGQYRQVYNEDNSSSIDHGWYVYEKGSYYKMHSEENIDWEHPLSPKETTPFMEKLSEGFESLKKTATGEYIYDFFSSKEKSIQFQYDSQENGINGTPDHRVFICTSKQDPIPTTHGSNPIYSPLWVSIGHEMAHRIDYYKRGDKLCNETNFGGYKNTEIYATHMENRMRGEAQLPLRTHYDENNSETLLLV